MFRYMVLMGAYGVSIFKFFLGVDFPECGTTKPVLPNIFKTTN